MPQEPLGEKVGNKLEEGLVQAVAGVKDLAAKAGVGSGTRAATRTKDELYADAVRLGIKGRSKMNKAELEKAVRRA